MTTAFLPTSPQSPISLSGSRSGRYLINVVGELVDGDGSKWTNSVDERSIYVFMVFVLLAPILSI
ncbi:hypothetical protein XBKB1_2770004 [Xenorhabdus bovienii str. kraussei Becker Underwood]|uniref:Uncharacterized protein n=1 Tax=Xenorhabdus bovienii str. kraussei Becker Underwood TaxID=1398204 RepID=A0A077PUQ1_XENBV|nr:hypothetical protein XBKB1_2770004 [Xenorhabdus bovienii str. kraussei Becker Underwood]